MTYGCMGQVLWVDLTRGTFREEELPAEFYQSYLAGIGLGVRLLYDRIPPGADPLGPENILGLTSGFLCGTGALFMGRWMAMAKSPLTGGWGDANCGGNFAPAIKKAGYDAIFFTGASEKPVYLRILNGKKELLDASHLWGMDTVETEKRIAADAENQKLRIVCIGPAGEKLSLISGIVNDGGRVAARSGLGAVMGSKRLKAVAIADHREIKAAEPGRIKQLNQEFLKWFNGGKSSRFYLTGKMMRIMGRVLSVSPIAIAVRGDAMRIVLRRYGTIVANVIASQSGDSPVKNWTGSGRRDFPIASHSGKLDPDEIIKHEKRKYHCYACPVGCGGVVSYKDSQSQTREAHKPEYETCSAFGSLLLNKDPRIIFEINDLLNRAGLDTISTGGAVAFAIECAEQGLLAPEMLGGLKLEWGNAAAILALVRKIIVREGIGDLLADGVRVAAQKIGKNAADFAVHAGGQELPMHDSRYDPGFAVSYGLDPTPGRHNTHSIQWWELYGLHRLIPGMPKKKPFYRVKRKYEVQDKAVLWATTSNFVQTFNAAGGCLFGAQMDGRLKVFDYLNAAGGWKHSPEFYLRIGERIQLLRQAFNFKQGIQPRRDFRLPSRAIGRPPLDSGPLKGIRVDFEQLSRNYLREIGWDPKTAKPTRRKLEDLGLAEVADEIDAS